MNKSTDIYIIVCESTTIYFISFATSVYMGKIMALEKVEIKKSINSAFFKTPISQSTVQTLRRNLETYVKRSLEGESEEFHKNLIKDFLNDTWYKDKNFINTYNKKDLAIYAGKNPRSNISVLIEAKSPSNKNEMFTIEKPNCKALQECVLYFLQEAVINGNKEIKHIIITNYDDYYIFEAKDFSRFFVKELGEEVQKFTRHAYTDNTTDFFYQNFAKPAIDRWIEKEHIRVTHFSPKKDFYLKSDDELIPLYKIFSPEHLLGKPFANDSNTLDKNFYAELLHIIGLEEVKEGGKKIIKRKAAEKRDSASLIENSMFQLEDQIFSESERFETALRLCITWINRLLFLKLVESQQLSYQKGNSDYKFLTSDIIEDFSELNILFFKVLGRKINERDKNLKEKYRFVPYLNSSLFELSEEENFLQIRGLQNNPLPLFKRTVLKDKNGKRLTGKKAMLDYIFEFLDAYNFSSDGTYCVTDSNKTLINASVLGLIFEKINGYKDGSFFTPGFITEYMAKESVERTIIQKFNEIKNWNCKTLDDVGNEIETKEDREEANAIINSLRICDPAVGSGHFLVSVLNRILYIKSYLNILQNEEGKRILRGNWELHLDNDEISIWSSDGTLFTYESTNSEKQFIQETIFNEKRIIIENCLFGVDINPASVYICRLRLWIELLKNAYYTKESDFTQLETLPNIDINIKCGNSLVSKFPVEIGTTVIKRESSDKMKDKEITELIKQYRDCVLSYKNLHDKKAKHDANDKIMELKNKFRGEAQLYLFDTEKNSNTIFRNSMEWMLEFPEVLDDEGRFLGFDAVIGNPPYFNIQTLGAKSTYAEFVMDNFKDIWQDKSDILFYFFKLAMMLTKGTICFITSNAYMFSDKAQKLRNKMLDDGRLRRIINFEEYMIFPEASITTCITLLSNNSEKFNAVVFKGRDSSIDDVINYISNYKNAFSVTLSHDSVFALVDSRISDLNSKIDGEHNKLSDLFKIGKGMETAANNVFCFSEYPKQFPKKFIKRRMCGEIIKKYVHSETEEYVLYFENVLNFEDLPQNIQSYLEQNKSILNARAQIKRSKTSVWWKYTFSMHKEYYHLNKIWTSYRNKTNEFSLDESTDYIGLTNTTVIFDTNKDICLKYLLALLNSKVLTFRYKSIGKQTGSGVYEYFENGVGKLPIPLVSSAQQQKLVNLVDKILVAKKDNPDADTTKLESEIDSLVYELYGLNAEDIAIIEKG